MSTFQHLTSACMSLLLLQGIPACTLHSGGQETAFPQICFHCVLLQLNWNTGPILILCSQAVKVFKRALYKHILQSQIINWFSVYFVYILDFLDCIILTFFCTIMLRGTFERSLGHFTPFSLLFSIFRIKVFIIIIIISRHSIHSHI